MPNGTYGGVRGRLFRPTRFFLCRYAKLFTKNKIIIVHNAKIADIKLRYTIICGIINVSS